MAGLAQEVVQEAQRERIAGLAVDEARERAAEARAGQAEAALHAAQAWLALRRHHPPLLHMVACYKRSSGVRAEVAQVRSECQGRDIVDYPSAEPCLASSRSRALRYSAIAHQRHAVSPKNPARPRSRLGWWRPGR